MGGGLGFLPDSHSIGGTLALAVLAWAVVRWGLQRPAVATAIALGIISHAVLDILHHEPDIALLPFGASRRLGLGLATIPAADLVVESIYGVLCWLVFGGAWGLLVAIVVFNILNIPLMFPQPGSIEMLAHASRCIADDHPRPHRADMVRRRTLRPHTGDVMG